jgi:phage terminase large subunit-like protein
MANPGLGPIKKIEKQREFVNKALQDPSYKPTVLVKDFNLNENENAAWLRSDAAVNKIVLLDEVLRDAYCIGGCDLSSTIDLTCATLLLKKTVDGPWIVLQKYFLPESKMEEVEQQRDPEAPYRIWAEQGWLTVCEGTQVRYSDVTDWFVSMVKERNLRPLWIGYDRALAGYWTEEMQSNGFDMEKIAQGAKTWTYPFKSLKAEFQAHNVIYQDNPMLLWCLMNTRVKSLNAEGIESQMPVKIKANSRIDGTVSLLNAYTCMKNHEEEYMEAVRRAERRTA